MRSASNTYSGINEELSITRSLVKAEYTMSPKDTEFSIQVLANAYWAGCAAARESTTSVVVQVLNNTIHHHSKAQLILATSSGESELYDLVSATVYALHMRTFRL